MSWQPNQPSSSLVVTGGGTESTSSSQTTRISTCDDTKLDDTAGRSADVPASCAAESVDLTSEQSSQQEQQRQQLESDRNMASMAEDILDFETPSLRSKTHLVESTRQQQDREFFRRFLNPLVGGSQDSETDEQLAVDKNDTSLIVDKLPQISQRNVPWAPVYTLPLIYATSGANQHHYQNALRNDSLFGSGGGASAPIQSGPSTSSSAAFYDGLGLPSTNLGNSNSERIFYGGGNLLDSYTDNPLTSDNNNGGGGGSSGQFAFQAAKLASNLYQSDYRQQIGSGRTYSGVLNNPSALGPYTSSLFDMHDRQTPTTNNNRDFFSNLNDPSNLFSAQASGNHQQHNHLANRNQSRPFNQSDFFSIGDDQQQQQNRASSHQMINSHQYQAHTSGQPGGRSNNSNHMMIQHGGRNPPGYFASQQQRAAFDRSGFSLTGSTIPKRRHKLPPFAATSNEAGRVSKFDAHGSPMVGAGAASGSNADGERFSRKVFVGGLPPDIDEEEIKASFRSFGALVVDWPHKAESKSYFPPKGYAFLLFQEEASVQTLIDSCFQENDKLYLCVSSPTTKDKPVQIRPWRLSDTDYVLDSTLALDPRKTVFVGGVPRPLKASELANIMNNLYGGVCYAGIDTDPDLKYPKGAGRVAFSNHQSYIAAISARFVHIHHSELEKRVEVKPYVLDDQFCDECQGARCGNKFAPFFCANITCLRYYCDSCWSSVHSQGGREFHKPLVKEGGDRPRGAQSLRW